jgi:hypothetical protein
MSTGASAVGERGVSVGGDVVGSVIVTGDNNYLSLVLGPEQGALLERLPRDYRLTKRLRAGPLRSVRPAFANTVNRDPEVAAILDGLALGQPVNLYGERGVGKTCLVLRAANGDLPVLTSRVVYLNANGPLEDISQQVFEAWYECDPPVKPSLSQLRGDLDAVHGAVALDR